jgi:hypothetical protein
MQRKFLNGLGRSPFDFDNFKVPTRVTSTQNSDFAFNNMGENGSGSLPGRILNVPQRIVTVPKPVFEYPKPIDIGPINFDLFAPRPVTTASLPTIPQPSIFDSFIEPFLAKNEPALEFRTDQRPKPTLPTIATEEKKSSKGIIIGVAVLVALFVATEATGITKVTGLNKSTASKRKPSPLNGPLKPKTANKKPRSNKAVTVVL